MDLHRPDREADLNATELRLGRLRPSDTSIVRDRLIFEAGRAAARAELRGRLPMALAAGFALVAVGLGGLLARERSERRTLEGTLAATIREATPPPRSTPTETPPRPLEPDSFLALTRQFLAEGPDPAPGVARRGDSSPAFERANPAPAPLRARWSGSHVDL